MYLQVIGMFLHAILPGLSGEQTVTYVSKCRNVYRVNKSKPNFSYRPSILISLIIGIYKKKINQQRKITVLCFVSFLIVTPAHAGLWGTITSYGSKALAMATHSPPKNLEELGFKNVYHKAYYKHRYFKYGVTSLVIAGTVASTLTGVGAPAAGTGVSYIASLVGGEVSGAYMIGLSEIGGYFGGNAMLGAAILNGSSALAGKVAMGGLENIVTTAIMLDGVAYIPATNTYYVRLVLPNHIGGTESKALIEQIFETDEALGR